MTEFSAANVRTILQQIFPERRLVLSQFTFFNQCGVAKATGETFRRGRRCYRMFDILPIATVLMLKEEGIPLCNIESVPSLIQDQAAKIFEIGSGCRLSGFGNQIALTLPGEFSDHRPLAALLAEDAPHNLFWSIDVGALAQTLRQIVHSQREEEALPARLVA